MLRNPNTICKLCSKAIYRRPFEIESYGTNLYCSRQCMFMDRKKFVKCPTCGNDFQKKNRKQIFCSQNCSAKITRNRLGTKKGYRKQNKTETNLKKLYDAFGFKTCMVRDCNYCKTFDLHRLVEGRNGGKYIIGNMFAICPNHHAECHRGLLVFKKISDCELVAESVS